MVMRGRSGLAWTGTVRRGVAGTAGSSYGWYGRRGASVRGRYRSVGTGEVRSDVVRRGRCGMGRDAWMRMARARWHGSLGGGRATAR